ncbi:MAG: hemin-degrading factor, partial [Betaproteobacteria bacterium]|nr:hemin-degrading factor [Betaproteobacteria bacterium]
DDAQGILQAVEPLGRVMALTRNASCVHERKGVYSNCEFFKHGKMAMGLFVNPDIDLRLFMNHWRYSFAAIEQTRSGARKSLQFFDREGVALHKIYLTDHSNEAEYDRLVEQRRHQNQDRFIAIEQYGPDPEERPDEEIDWPAFRTAWKNLKDTHDFHPLLRKFKIGRAQAFANADADMAWRVENGAARQVLEQGKDSGCQIMVFVGNRGCLQIHTGPVNKLVEFGDWFNVLDPMFNLHLREDHIAAGWVTRKPTVDGIVTALEVFDDRSRLIATFFGKRKPGSPELDGWREIIAALPRRQADGE